MRHEVDEALGRLDEVFDAVIRSAEFDAQEICEPFWERTAEIRETKRPKDWFKYSVSIRGEEGGSGIYRLRIDWSEIVWVPMSSSGGGGQKWKMRSKYLKRTATGKYSMRQFAKAGAEEKALIAETINQLEKINDVIKLIGSMRKSKANVLRKYKRR